MKTLTIAVAAATLLATGATTGSAHQVGGTMMQQMQPGAGQMMPNSGQGAAGMMGPGMMTGPGMMMGPGMMVGGGMMGHGMSHMMTIMMDTDGDGALSLEEYEAVHKRMFHAMDLDGDGKLTGEEMGAFMQEAWPAPDQDE